jgi:hypothetical protein
MTTAKRQLSKIPKWADRQHTHSTRLDAGPYEAVVKNNLDPTRSGRLQVWIPDMGGDQNNPLNWRTVNYASPYMGTTNQPANQKNINNTYENTRNTYGMWAIPPDIGNIVLCTFVAGDPDRGYWFACVVNNLSHWMLPANGGSDTFDAESIKDEDLKKAVTLQSVFPTSEFNENVERNVNTDFYYVKRPVHEYQAKILIKQGLDRDPVRGAIESSGQRDIPSQVFGISTPGRPLVDPVDDPNYASKIKDATIKEEDFAVRVRKGGHSFVMDDGEMNETGTNQLMRFRTAGGHQILMNDTERTIYIANSEGSCWVELAGSGHMHLFADRGINIRTAGDFNLHADGNMNVQVQKDLNINAQGKINIESNELNQTSIGSSTLFGGSYNIGSSGALAVQSAAEMAITAGGDLREVGSKIYLNSGAGAGVEVPAEITKYKHENPEPDSERGGIYVPQPNKINSIAPIVPTHEPWGRTSGEAQLGAAASTAPQTGGSEAAAEAAGATTGKQKINDLPAPVGNVTVAGDCKPKNVVTTGSGGVLTDGSGKPVTSGTGGLDPGPASAQGKSVKRPCPKSYISRSDNPSPPGGIGPLSQFQVKCIMTAMGHAESDFNYGITNTIGFVGKYQFGAAALVETKFLKRDYYNQKPNNSCCKIDQAWTGRLGCTSLASWLKNPAAQEQAMYELVNLNYKNLVNKKGIKPDDDLCTIAGMLCVAQLLGSSGATKWRKTAQGADAYGSTGEKYFNIGRYAIDVLAAGQG